jgi:hypothetical protein
MAVEERLDDLSRFYQGVIESYDEDFQKMKENHQQDIDAYKEWVENLKDDIVYFKNLAKEHGAKID